jgi:hypothetical protein
LVAPSEGLKQGRKTRNGYLNTKKKVGLFVCLAETPAPNAKARKSKGRKEQLSYLVGIFKTPALAQKGFICLVKLKQSFLPFIGGEVAFKGNQWVYLIGIFKKLKQNGLVYLNTKKKGCFICLLGWFGYLLVSPTL